MPVPGQHVNLAQNRPSPTSPVPPIYRVWLCCLGVLADESIEDRSSSHPCRGKIRDQWRGRVGGRWEQLSCLVRPVRVAVGDALAQRGEQVAFNVDEGLIRALPAGGAHPAFRERVRSRCLRWGYARSGCLRR